MLWCQTEKSLLQGVNATRQCVLLLLLFLLRIMWYMCVVFRFYFFDVSIKAKTKIIMNNTHQCDVYTKWCNPHLPLKFKAIRVWKCERVFICCCCCYWLLLLLFYWECLDGLNGWQFCDRLIGDYIIFYISIYDQVHLMLQFNVESFQAWKSFSIQMFMTFTMCNGSEFFSKIHKLYNSILIFFFCIPE